MLNGGASSLRDRCIGCRESIIKERGYPLGGFRMGGVTDLYGVRVPLEMTRQLLYPGVDVMPPMSKTVFRAIDGKRLIRALHGQSSKVVVGYYGSGWLLPGPRQC